MNGMTPQCPAPTQKHPVSNQDKNIGNVERYFVIATTHGSLGFFLTEEGTTRRVRAYTKKKKEQGCIYVDPFEKTASLVVYNSDENHNVNGCFTGCIRDKP